MASCKIVMPCTMQLQRSPESQAGSKRNNINVSQPCNLPTLASPSRFRSFHWSTTKEVHPSRPQPTATGAFRSGVAPIRACVTLLCFFKPSLCRYARLHQGSNGATFFTPGRTPTTHQNMHPQS